jgi:hypothetical protein
MYGPAREITGTDRQAFLGSLSAVYGQPADQIEARLRRGEVLYSGYAKYFATIPVDSKPDPV